MLFDNNAGSDYGEDFYFDEHFLDASYQNAVTSTEKVLKQAVLKVKVMICDFGIQHLPLPLLGY